MTSLLQSYRFIPLKTLGTGGKSPSKVTAGNQTGPLASAPSHIRRVSKQSRTKPWPFETARYWNSYKPPRSVGVDFGFDYFSELERSEQFIRRLSEIQCFRHQPITTISVRWSSFSTLVLRDNDICRTRFFASATCNRASSAVPGSRSGSYGSDKFRKTSV